MFYKFHKNKCSFKLFKLIPEKHTYVTRNVYGIPLIKIKHNIFKNTFFPYVIIEWNKLDPNIWNAENFGIFNHNGIRLMTRLSLGLSHPREHKFNHNSQNCVNLFVVVVWISNQCLSFFSTVPYVMIKQPLSWAL